jgi:hypothetical protein
MPREGIFPLGQIPAPFQSMLAESSRAFARHWENQKAFLSEFTASRPHQSCFGA